MVTGVTTTPPGDTQSRSELSLEFVPSNVALGSAADASSRLTTMCVSIGVSRMRPAFPGVWLSALLATWMILSPRACSFTILLWICPKSDGVVFSCLGCLPSWLPRFGLMIEQDFTLRPDDNRSFEFAGFGGVACGIGVLRSPAVGDAY